MLEADGQLPFTDTTETAFGYKGLIQLEGDQALGREAVEVFVVGRLTAASFAVPASPTAHVQWPPASLWEGDYQRSDPVRGQAPQFDVEAVTGHRVSDEVRARPDTISACTRDAYCRSDWSTASGGLVTLKAQNSGHRKWTLGCH